MKFLTALFGLLLFSFSVSANEQYAQQLKFAAGAAEEGFQQAMLGKKEGEACFRLGSAFYPVDEIKNTLAEMSSSGYNTEELSKLADTVFAKYAIASGACLAKAEISKLSQDEQKKIAFALHEGIIALKQIGELKVMMKK